jgi:hypothetical protein
MQAPDLPVLHAAFFCQYAGAKLPAPKRTKRILICVNSKQVKIWSYAAFRSWHEILRDRPTCLHSLLDFVFFSFMQKYA